MICREATRWLRLLRPAAAARRRLVCFPYAGGGATVFQGWARGLPDDIELRAVQLPGRQERLSEPHLTDIRQMQERVIEALDALPPLPLTLYGHSMGGLLAYEVTRGLEARGDMSRFGHTRLVLGACRPPHHQPRPAGIRHLPTEEFIAALELRYDAPIELRDPCVRAFALPLLRADITAGETHTFEAGPPLIVDLTVLVGLRDRAVPPILAAGWRSLAAGDFDVHQIDAGHLFIDTHPEWVRNHVANYLH